MANEFDDFDNEIQGGVILPPQPAELPEIKLFGRWSCDDVQVNDMSLHVRKLYKTSLTINANKKYYSRTI